MAPATTLFYFTNQYPYGNGETFVKDELYHLAGRYTQVLLFCEAKPGQEKREVPQNVRVIPMSSLPAGSISFAQYFTILKIFLGELFFSRQRSLFLKSWRYYLSYLMNAHRDAHRVEAFLKDAAPATSTFYTYWFSDKNLVLSLLKRRGKIDRIYTRAHGFDIYEFTSQLNYLPFRRFCMALTDGIFPVSEMGTRYLQERYPAQASKIRTSYLGTSDHGLQETLPAADHFHLVSCSKIIPLKRIHLIAEALRDVKRSLTWTHIGEGAERAKIEQIVNALPAHITVQWKGQMTQDAIFHFYKTTPIDALINTSVSEGLPVSIMEAISFGIPVMATDVGGTREIVRTETGVLLPADVQPAAIAALLNSEQMKQMDRVAVRQFWETHFSANRNYSRYLQEEAH